MLDKILSFIAGMLTPTRRTVSTEIGNLQVVEYGEMCVIEIRGHGSGKTGTVNLSNLPAPTAYMAVPLYYGTSIVALLIGDYGNTNKWQFKRLSGSSGAYGSAVFVKGI